MLVLVANPFARPVQPLAARAQAAVARFRRGIARLAEAPSPATLTAGQDAVLRLDLALLRGRRRSAGPR